MEFIRINFNVTSDEGEDVARPRGRFFSLIVAYNPPNVGHSLHISNQSDEIVPTQEGGVGTVLDLIMQIINRGHPENNEIPQIGAEAIQTIILLPGGALNQRRASRPASEDAIAQLDSGLLEEESLVLLLHDVCLVCHELFMVGNAYTSMPCLHTFHKPCLDTWLGLHSTCPVCRHALEAVPEDPMDAAPPMQEIHDMLTAAAGRAASNQSLSSALPEAIAGEATQAPIVEEDAFESTTTEDNYSSGPSSDTSMTLASHVSDHEQTIGHESIAVAAEPSEEEHSSEGLIVLTSPSPTESIRQPSPPSTTGHNPRTPLLSSASAHMRTSTAASASPSSSTMSLATRANTGVSPSSPQPVNASTILKDRDVEANEGAGWRDGHEKESVTGSTDNTRKRRRTLSETIVEGARRVCRAIRLT